jgi:hypothetical protein
MFQHLGREMGIANIYTSYEEAEEYLREYEKKHMRFSPHNSAVAEVSVGVDLKLFPQCCHGCIRQVLYTLASPDLRAAMVSISKSKSYGDSYLNIVDRICLHVVACNKDHLKNPPCSHIYML